MNVMQRIDTLARLGRLALQILVSHFKIEICETDDAKEQLLLEMDWDFDDLACLAVDLGFDECPAAIASIPALAKCFRARRAYYQGVSNEAQAFEAWDD